MRQYYSAERFAALNGDADVRVDRIVYSSDGLKIPGFRIEPKHPEGKLPVIVWCTVVPGDRSHLH